MILTIQRQNIQKNIMQMASYSYQKETFMYGYGYGKVLFTTYFQSLS